MEGCKSGWVEPLSEETAQEMIKVLNELRTASELEEISNRLADRIFEDILKDIGLNEDIMKEKKTKKMTKAEAFEYLKEKKIDASINEREVQLKLFSIGVVWCTLDSEPTLGVGYLLIDKECHMTHCGSDWGYYKTHHYEEISADDILSIEIVEEKNGEEAALDLISTVGARLSKVLRDMEGHKHVVITEDGVILYEEGMCLFHSDPF